MSTSKQDRQAARTTADLEYRYKFGKSFAEFMGIAEKASAAAQKATEAVESLDGNLTQQEIFRRLTNDGKAQGVFMDETGEIFINASYLAAGIIASVNGTVKLDLASDTLTISIPASEVYYRNRSIVFSEMGIEGYGESSVLDGVMHQTLVITPAIYAESDADQFNATLTRIYSIDSDLVLAATNNGTLRNALRLGLDETSIVKIKDKTVSWKDNGDGTYTLIGTDE